MQENYQDKEKQQISTINKEKLKKQNNQQIV